MLDKLLASIEHLAHPAPSRARRRDALEAWSLLMGREAAELWLDALASSDLHQPVHR